MTPTTEHLFTFIRGTHACDKVELTTKVISDTWQQKTAPNPYAHGHFRAFNHLFQNLIPSDDFPAKLSYNLKTTSDSEKSLVWLKDLHKYITLPIIESPLFKDDFNAPKAFDAGRLRTEQTMSITKKAVDPALIPKVLFNWLKDYTEYHESIKDKLKTPYGITREESKEIVDKSYQVNLFFSTVKPLACLNQRMGRFLENAFRIKWGLPMKIYFPDTGEYRKLIPNLEDYQDTVVPKLIEKAVRVK